MKVSIIIPSWNGKKLLEKNIKSVIDTKPAEIIVVDDASPDDSNNFLSMEYPQIKIVHHEKNLGFSSACNSGVRVASGEIIVLLNLDVVPEKDSLKYIMPHFKDPNLFAVSFNEPNWSWARLVWKNGFVEHEPGVKTDKTHVSAWASGGSAAFRKEHWEKLGGFDELYKPFYWEDVDLGYRAWKRGYKIVWEPKAVVHHMHEAIIGKYFSKKYIGLISERNRLLFMWKNITSVQMIFDHKIWLGKKLITSPGYWWPFLAATKKLSKAISKRQIERSLQQISDEEVFSQFLVK